MTGKIFSKMSPSYKWAGKLFIILWLTKASCKFLCPIIIIDLSTFQKKGEHKAKYSMRDEILVQCPNVLIQPEISFSFLDKNKQRIKLFIKIAHYIIEKQE